MKQEGNTGQAPGSTMRFVKPASWMKLLLSNLASLSRIRTICINLLPTNLMVLHPIIQSPLSNFHNVPCWCGLLLKSWENSMSRVLITSPVRSDALQSPEIMVQPVQRAARKLPVVCGTENTLKNWQIASKLKKTSQVHIVRWLPLRTFPFVVRDVMIQWPMTHFSYCLVAELREKAAVFRSPGPWQVSESCREICESFKVFWTSSHFCSACLPLVTLNSYANLTKWNLYASNLDLMFRATKWETLTQVQCETAPK